MSLGCIELRDFYGGISRRGSREAMQECGPLRELWVVSQTEMKAR